MLGQSIYSYGYLFQVEGNIEVAFVLDEYIAMYIAILELVLLLINNSKQFDANNSNTITSSSKYVQKMHLSFLLSIFIKTFCGFYGNAFWYFQPRNSP